MAARTTSRTPASSNTRRISFAKITEPFEVPQLLSLQTDSFDWLIGNEAWDRAVERRRGEGEDVSSKSGLQEIFEEISPIEDFSETMSLSFENPVFYDPKYSVDECKEKDFTYSAPLYVSAEFTNNDTGEIKGQTVFMGDFPLMTDKGTFIINGTERVVVSQLVRSPGVYFERTPDKTSDKDIYTTKLIPCRGAWLEFEIDKRDMVGVRLDRKRKQNVTVLLKALGLSIEDIRHEFGDPNSTEGKAYESIELTLEKDHTVAEDDALLDIYRKLRPGEPPTREAAQTLLNNYYFNPKRYDLAKVGRYKVNKKLGLVEAFDQQTLTLDDVVAAIRYIVALHDGREQIETPAGRPRDLRRRHRPLRQPPDAHGRRADPEPAAHRPGPDGARGPRADDDPGRRGDHAAVPDQHPTGRGGAEGVLRHLAALAVHGPDQPDRGPDAQAPAQRARPWWSVP